MSEQKDEHKKTLLRLDQTTFVSSSGSDQYELDHVETSHYHTTKAEAEVETETKTEIIAQENTSYQPSPNSTGLRKRFERKSSSNELQSPTMSVSSPRGYDFAEEMSPLRQGKDEIFKFENFNIWVYFKREMFGIGEPGHLDHEAVDNIDNFLAIPLRLEFLLSFGFIICFDAFLFVLAYLPFRGLFSIWLIGCEIISFIYRKYLSLSSSSSSSSSASSSMGNGKSKSQRSKRNSGIYFHRTNLYDLIRSYLLVFGCGFLLWLDMSRVYHFIRGQTMIKLYVLTAMLEMLDKLFATFGQDVFGSIYYLTRTNPSDIASLIKLIIIAMVYVALHSSIFFVNIATLAVAVNSSDRSLLTVLILNNVSEIKSYVFKKFDKVNLFQLSCSDITERFHIGLFLFCIAIGSIAQSGPNWYDTTISLFFISLMFLPAEMIADSIKHAFIAKFNDISPTVYDDFVKVLRNDILNSHKDKVILDQTYAIARRVGLSQIPLGCVFVRYTIMAVMSPNWLEEIQSWSWAYTIMVSTGMLCILLIMKTIVGIGLVFYAGKLHNMDLKQRQTEMDANQPTETTKEDPDSTETLAGIERFTSIKGRIVG